MCMQMCVKVCVCVCDCVCVSDNWCSSMLAAAGVIVFYGFVCVCVFRQRGAVDEEVRRLNQQVKGRGQNQVQHSLSH